MGVGVLGPGMQPDQRHSLGRNRRRQQSRNLRVTVPGERRDGHRVVAGVAGVPGVDVWVGVDPDDRQVIAVAVGEDGEGSDAGGAFTADGGDPGRLVLADDVQRSRELLDDHGLGLDPVELSQPVVAHRD